MKSIYSARLLLFVMALGAVMSTGSCGKKWKETTTADFVFSINKNETPGHLHFYSGNMRLSNIQFTGIRKRGGDVIFTNNTGTFLDFSSGSSNPSVSYQIPQGTYSSISMQFQCIAADSSNPSIFLVGKFVQNPNDTVPVYFQFDADQVFNTVAQSSSGSGEITLTEDHPVSVQVTFDPSYWFASIPPGQLIAATHVPVNSQSAIVISSLINADIYQSVESRIAESTRVVIE